MALSRGGDQAVVKNRFNFEFFGGRGNEVETRTKVKSRVMANALAELVADSSRVFVMGHKFADLDAVGASVAVCCIARKKGKLCRIVIDPVKNSAAAADRPAEGRAGVQKRLHYRAGGHAPGRQRRRCWSWWTRTAPSRWRTRTSSTACNRVAVIDHHRRAATYIQNAAPHASTSPTPPPRASS